MQEDSLELRIQILSALADKTRLSLIKKIAEGPLKGSSCSSLLANFSLSQPAMSHHFKILITSGIIKQKKEGRKNYYSIDSGLLEQAGININQLIN
jgi:ArsR family transcriptional regulator